MIKYEEKTVDIDYIRSKPNSFFVCGPAFCAFTLREQLGDVSNDVIQDLRRMAKDYDLPDFHNKQSEYQGEQT